MNMLTREGGRTLMKALDTHITGGKMALVIGLYHDDCNDNYYNDNENHYNDKIDQL